MLFLYNLTYDKQQQNTYLKSVFQHFYEYLMFLILGDTFDR